MIKNIRCILSVVYKEYGKVTLYKYYFMTGQLVDNEFNKYWNLLTAVQKESLLNVAKNYVQLSDKEEDISETRKKMIQAERNAYLKSEGKSFSWQQVKEMALNKDKRHEL